MHQEPTETDELESSTVETNIPELSVSERYQTEFTSLPEGVEEKSDLPRDTDKTEQSSSERAM